MKIRVGLDYILKDGRVVVTYLGEEILTVIYTSTGKRQNMTINQFKKHLA